VNRKDHIDSLGATSLILFSVLLGLNQALVKLVNVGFSPVFQAGLRSACAFFLVLIAAMLLRRKLSVTDGTLGAGIVAGLLFSFEFYLLFTALEYTTVSRVSMLFYTQPFWVALAAHFLIPGEQLHKSRIIGLLLAVGGVIVLLAKPGDQLGPDAMIGDLMCIAASIAWAGIALMPRLTPLGKCSPEMMLLYQLAISAIILVAIAPFFGDLVRELTPTIVAIFSFQVVVIVAFGFLLWFWALSVYPASDVTSFGLLAPAFGVFFGWLIFSEEITLVFMIALALISSGIVLINKKPTAEVTA
jgi:drug/metabolite transporter (DMT)-like permease